MFIVAFLPSQLMGIYLDGLTYTARNIQQHTTLHNMV